jgi:hypothetical protein
MPIFDLLGSELQDDLINNAINIGNVLKLDCDFTNPPKQKRLILVNINPLIGFFIINSRLNEFVINSDLLSSQVLILKDEHAFIEHDSFVACDEIIYKFTRTEIEQQLKGDFTRFLGTINLKLRNILIETCLRSETLKQVEIEVICKNLDSLKFD